MSDDELAALMRETQTEGYPSDVRRLVDAAVAAERAWFVQVLSEWDRTSDVEDVLRLRLAAATSPAR